MKIVTWNCQQAFEKKAKFIFAGSPDIVVIQECSKKSAELGYEGYFGQWAGGSATRGLGVFCKENWTLSRLGEPKEDDPKWIVPYQVRGSLNFTLIAVWACAVKGKPREDYVGQIHLALSKRPEWFTDTPVVMAGDFNSNAIFDRNRGEINHSSMVDELRKHGLESAYHALNGRDQGVAEVPTFHMYRKVERPFHLDYIFIPIKWRSGSSLEIGSHEEWSSKSDHCPLTVEISPSKIPGI